MKASIRDPETLKAIRPSDLIAYLLGAGWHRTEIVSGGEYWAPATGDDVLVPVDPHLRDYSFRIADVLAGLETFEHRPQTQIFDDLLGRSSDIIRPRVLNAGADGTITLEQGAILYSGSRNLMLAAACAAIETQIVFPRRKPDVAMEYINRARFGMPRMGSYEMTIFSPVTASISSDGDLLGNPPAEPFERRAVRLLMSGLAAATRTTRQISAGGSQDALRDTVPSGVSANLLEAVVEMYKACGDQQMEISVGWSPLRQAPLGVESRVIITQQDAAGFNDAAKYLRLIVPIENILIEGTVDDLHHSGGSSGDVTIHATVDGVERNVHVTLSGRDHGLAHKAYYERDNVSCRGRLEHEGRHWRLVNPTDFRVDQLFLPTDETPPGTT